MSPSFDSCKSFCMPLKLAVVIFLTSAHFIATSSGFPKTPAAFMDKLWPFAPSQWPQQTQYNYYKPPLPTNNNYPVAAQQEQQQDLAPNSLGPNKRYELAEQHHLEGATYPYNQLSDRYDYDTDDSNGAFYDIGASRHHQLVQAERGYLGGGGLGVAESKSGGGHGLLAAGEAKEISLVYPVLLAVLIIGALFIPFVSLFFFLTVSAFNCNGMGSFAQVQPFLGRRRRRRRRRSISDAQEDSGVKQILFELTSGRNRTTNGTREQDLITSSMITATTTRPNLGHVSDVVSAASSSSMLLQDDALHYNLDADFYGFWRKQLARSTVKLLSALGEFGGDMDEPGGVGGNISSNLLGSLGV